MANFIKECEIGVRDPRRIASKSYELYDRRLRQTNRIKIPNQDWDTLIILDGCRFNTFEEYDSLPGEPCAVRSLGSKTSEFLTKNFDNGEFPEIVYVSANPNTENFEAKFHARIRLWEDYWDNELNVVPPSAVADAAIRASSECPDKRIIVHFMQPHIPFIREFGRQLLARDDVEDRNHGVDFWTQMRSNQEIRDLFKHAYRENLEMALPHVRRTAKQLCGLTVVTSDHGNEFGWAGVYGHPGGFYTPGLVIIPWLELPYEDQKTIRVGDATAGPNATIDIQEKLSYVGYR